MRRAAQCARPILWAVDGFAVWSSGILKVFRDPRPTGQHGRPPLAIWPDLYVVQVVKQYAGRKLQGAERRLTYGCRCCAEAIMQAT